MNFDSFKQKHLKNFDVSVITFAEEKWSTLSSRCHHIYVISTGLVITFIIVAALFSLEHPVCDPERAYQRYQNSPNNTHLDNLNHHIVTTIAAILKRQPPHVQAHPHPNGTTEHPMSNATETEYEYVIIREILNNSLAQLSCSFWCGSLPSVHSRVENNYLRRLQLHSNLGLVWFGKREHDVVQNVFKWSDGTNFTFTSWAQGSQLRQYDGRPGGSCVAQDRFGRWHDIACEEELPFFCKRVKKH